MARKQRPDDFRSDDTCIGLRFPVPEQDALLASAHLPDENLRERVRKAGPREVISFTIEELEDLHRGLAFEADKTDDRKRAKTIGKVLQKIEEALGDDDDDDDDLADDLWGSGHDDGLYDDESDIEGHLDRFPDPLDGGPPMTPQDMLDVIFSSIGTGEKEAAPQFCVKLSPAEQATLRGMDTITLDVHKMVTPGVPDELELQLNVRQLMATLMAIKEAVSLVEGEAAAKPYVDLGERMAEGLASSIKEFEAADREELAAIDDNQRYRESQQTPATVAYQLKITLDDSKPAIWRTVQVADCPLDVLHQVVQLAMGWTNSHLHQFEFEGDQFTDPRDDLDDGGNNYDETKVRLSDLVAAGCKKLAYWYDFGDDWLHTIAFEKTLTPGPADKFPVCLDGAGACPPEDSGGIWSYHELLQALRTPKKRRYRDAVDFVGPDFDPDHFDIEETNKALAAGERADFE